MYSRINAAHHKRLPEPNLRQVYQSLRINRVQDTINSLPNRSLHPHLRNQGIQQLNYPQTPQLLVSWVKTRLCFSVIINPSIIYEPSVIKKHRNECVERLDFCRSIQFLRGDLEWQALI
ncbi:hypothetical protein AG1IA_10254 [Rhizoctonia solani AG-1 IA]|uniref:Uncharacterized protein n=1 Tax=Thanatephorus cucumeris (strain AG1-IA) TaxID=983506 RepID=L8WC11_THACA|nr:hypothetical protein AG1IA_10254 [Rhizoctonia solani AG-1 IA]